MFQSEKTYVSVSFYLAAGFLADVKVDVYNTNLKVQRILYVIT